MGKENKLVGIINSCHYLPKKSAREHRGGGGTPSTGYPEKCVAALSQGWDGQDLEQPGVLEGVPAIAENGISDP